MAAIRVHTLIRRITNTNLKRNIILAVFRMFADPMHCVPIAGKDRHKFRLTRLVVG